MGNVNELRIIEIRNYLAKHVPNAHFSMLSFARRDLIKRKLIIDIYSPACIASHVCYYHHYYPRFSIFYSASVLLGLSKTDAYVLFLMAGYSGTKLPRDITPLDASAVLTYYLETGYFTWNIPETTGV